MQVESKETWWVIAESVLVEALHDVAAGEDPDEVFMRLSFECENGDDDDAA